MLSVHCATIEKGKVCVSAREKRKTTKKRDSAQTRPTMWEKGSDGNRIPVQIVKQEAGGNATVVVTTAGVSQQDLLSQAAATIKTEQQAVAIATVPSAAGGQ